MKEGKRPKGIYFDCNATTPLLSVAAQAAIATLHDRFANPSSAHWEGCRAQRLRESARSRAAGVLGVDLTEIIFTSGATESAHTAIFSALSPFARQVRSGQRLDRRVVLYGATEHKVVPEALFHWIEHLGLPFEARAIPVSAEGQYQLSFLRRELADCVLVCTMAVNNETGVIQNLDAVAGVMASSRERPLWLVDAVQGLGKIPLRFAEWGVDYAAFSGHKVYAPKGVGLLYVRQGAPFQPLLVGGGQESGRRSGTEALPALAGLSAVLGEWLKEDANDPSGAFRSASELAHIREQLSAALLHSFPQLVFNAPFEASVPTTINFSVPGIESTDLLLLFEGHGIFLSAGSACQSEKSRPSHVLEAMGVSPERLRSAVRLSFGAATSFAEVEEGCRRIRGLGAALRAGVSSTARVVCVSDGQQNCFLFLSEEAERCDALLIGRCAHADWRVAQVVAARNAVVGGSCADLHSESEQMRVGLQLTCGNWVATRVAQDALQLTHLSAPTIPVLVFKNVEALLRHSSADLETASSPTVLLLESWAGLERRWSLPFVANRLPQFPVATSGEGCDTDQVQEQDLELSFDQIGRQAPEACVVDVRERSECSPSSPYLVAEKHFGRPAQHQPLSEFICFLLRKLNEDPGRAQTFVFVCRSGGRSALAARVLRDFGWHNAFSLRGGLSCLSLASEQPPL